MRAAQVVIGANFGDEGKGLVTDYLAEDQTLVVRFNGGAQAGHTVCTPDGRRHVFQHIGSGTFRGAATFLSRFFICNPIVCNREYEELQLLGETPLVFVDPEAPLTTPWDMMLNQMAEQARGADRHGSCGLGINETIVRHEMVPLRVGDIGPRIETKLRFIRDAWVPRRLAEHVLVPTETWLRRLQSDDIMQSYIDELWRFHHKVIIDDPLPQYAGPVLFEGAQGLLLCEDHPFFPHVTRSQTGLRNVDTLAHEAGIETLQVHYVTRTYMTRHGPGPFPTEDDRLHYFDQTNRFNEWQGHLRFGRLDTELLTRTIRHDLMHSTRVSQVRLVITHWDQHDGIVLPDDLLILDSRTRPLCAWGPTRITLRDAP